MHIPPARRRRCVRVHYLRQLGRSLKMIAEQLDISVPTVRSDLKLVESHWSQIAAAAADDLLLESVQLLQMRMTIAINRDHIAEVAQFLTPVELLRARDAREAQLSALAREIRRTVQEVHRRAEQRPDRPELLDDDAQKDAQKLAQTSPPDSAPASPGRDIAASDADQENSPPEPLTLPDPNGLDALIEESVQHFPHLKGQSPEQILDFLDRLTNPDSPPPAFTDAAG